MELKYAIEWKINATKGYKDNMGDRLDLPTDKEEVQQRRFHKKSHPLE
jgi:hypothetical protein